ncbi:NAD-dependent deacylase [Formosa sediminum]|uniref:NAD-dependent protein deacylase n=1 Tax=Formosa sediminum TaxID=2594004 RepID=A0A516GR18_9FLAO|nr:NAD-dependent deacylase [Formosa sediminum]QDO93975.1 NAD-dependent deacylase [Formosa sediminum]
MKHIVVLSGAGVSAESGLKTFRDADGLWEGHNVMDVATPEGFAKNPELVLTFYNERRKQLLNAKPNSAHYDLAALEKQYKVTIITQNVDDLHERAGSTNVLHLHGELLKARSVDNHEILPWDTDIKLGDLCAKGHQIRPHIVWFGEAVPMIDPAIDVCKTADILIIVGTSMQVYPAAGLKDYVPDGTPIFYIDPNPAKIYDKHINTIKEKASTGMKTVIKALSSQ